MPGRRPNPHLGPDILAASAQLLRAGGFSAFSIDAVAKAVGIPRSTVYSRWAGKTELLDDLLAGTVPRRAPLAPAARDALVELLETDLALAAGATGRAAAQLLLASRDPDGHDAPRLRTALGARRAQYVAVLRRAGLEPVDVERAAELTALAVWGATVLGPEQPAPDAGLLADAVLGPA